MNEYLKRLNRIGWWIFIPFLVFVVRLTWEKTYLTLMNGDQNIGFSLAHGYFAILYITPIASFTWTLVMLVQFIFRDKEERSNTDGRLWTLLILTLIAWGILLTPFDEII